MKQVILICLMISIMYLVFIISANGKKKETFLTTSSLAKKTPPEKCITKCEELKEVVDLIGCTTLQTIGMDAFKLCKKLESVDFTRCKALVTIRRYAFYECKSLVSVDFTGCTSLETIEREAFSICTSLVNVDFTGCKALETIELWAFSRCTSLEKMNFKGCTSLKTIGVGVFSFSNSLESVDFSDCGELETIRMGAFRLCTSLGSVDFTGCTSLKTIGEGAFYECTSLGSVDFTGCTSLKTIGGEAFYKCTSLGSVDFTGCGALESIGEMGFFECTSLEKVNFNGCGALESIGNEAFKKTSIIVINLRECIKLTKIDKLALGDVLKLESVMLPIHILEKDIIQPNAFNDSKNITNISFCALDEWNYDSINIDNIILFLKSIFYNLEDLDEGFRNPGDIDAKINLFGPADQINILKNILENKNLTVNTNKTVIIPLKSVIKPISPERIENEIKTKILPDLDITAENIDIEFTWSLPQSVMLKNVEIDDFPYLKLKSFQKKISDAIENFLSPCRILEETKIDNEIKIRINKIDCKNFDKPLIIMAIYQYLTDILTDSDIAEIEKIHSYSESSHDIYKSDSERKRKKKETLFEKIQPQIEFGGGSLVVKIRFIESIITKIYYRILLNKFPIYDKDVRGGISFSDGNVKKEILGLSFKKERDRLDKLKLELLAIKIGDEIFDMINNISHDKIDTLIINTIFDNDKNIYNPIKDHIKTNKFSVPKNAPLEHNDEFEPNLLLNTYKCNQGYSRPLCSQNKSSDVDETTPDLVVPTQGIPSEYETPNFYPLHHFNLTDPEKTSSPIDTTGSPKTDPEKTSSPIDTTGSPKTDPEKTSSPIDTTGSPKTDTFTTGPPIDITGSPKTS